MLQLMLFRHAKASWDEPSLPDEKRPLTPRGREAAAAMGRLLAERSLVPDLVLCSPARRAQQTLELALPHWSPQPGIRTADGLYRAIDDSYVDAVRSAPQTRRLMLIGHNPAMEETARRLVGEGTQEALAALLGGFKTGAVAVIDFESDSWREVAPKSGMLADFFVPS